MTDRLEPNAWPFVLDTTDPRWDFFEFKKAQLNQRPFRPDGANLLSDLADVESALRRHRSIIYFTVGWSVWERLSRDVFAAFVRQCTEDCASLNIAFYVSGEHPEVAVDLFDRLDLPLSAGTGYGEVIWLENGHVVQFLPNAREAGVNGLLSRTLECWAPA